MRWLARTIEPDGRFTWPARFLQVRSEDFKLEPLVIGAQVSIDEETGAQLYKIIKPLDFGIRTTPW